MFSWEHRETQGGNKVGGREDTDPLGDQSRDKTQQFLRDTAGRIGIGLGGKSALQNTRTPYIDH